MESMYEAFRDNTDKPAIMYTEGCAPHYHTHVELICVTAGQFDVTINGDRRILSEGEVGVAGSLDVHTYTKLTPDSQAIVLIATTKYLGGFELMTDKKPIKDHYFGGQGYFDIKALLETGKRYLNSNELAFRGIVDAILGIVAQNVTFSDRNGSRVDTHAMRDALTYIAENHTAEITLEGLSKKFGYSPNYFSKLFNTYFQKGLKEYVNAVRADHAVELIMSGTDVSNAAYMAGFDNMRTFYRAFKDRFGLTPQEYIKSKKSDISG